MRNKKVMCVILSNLPYDLDLRLNSGSLKIGPHCLLWFSFKESVSKSQNALGVWTTKVLTSRNWDSS